MKIKIGTSQFSCIKDNVKENMNKLSLSLARNTSQFVLALPQKILSLFVMLFLMFFLFIIIFCIIFAYKDKLLRLEVYKL